MNNREEKLKDLIEKVEAWAEERNLLKFENASKQYLKFLEETGELSRAILKNDVPEIVDASGDFCVCVIILAKQLGVKLETKMYDEEVDGVISLYDFVNLVSPSYVAWEFFSVADAVVKSHGYDLVECLDIAYNVISKRTGRTLNGTFIKD